MCVLRLQPGSHASSQGLRVSPVAEVVGCRTTSSRDPRGAESIEILGHGTWQHEHWNRNPWAMSDALSPHPALILASSPIL